MLDLLQENRPLAFLGFGALGEQIKNFLPQGFGNTVIFDDNIPSNNTTVFPFEDYLARISDFQWIVSIGYKHLARKVSIIENILEKKGQIKTVIHPSCYLAPQVEISGSVAYPMCNIDKGVTLQPGVIVNNSVIVSHDSYIGIGSYISPGVIISGNVKIGKGCFLGSGVVVSNGVEIGDFATVGVGSVVSRDVASNSQVIGNPMRFLSKKLILE